MVLDFISSLDRIVQVTDDYFSNGSGSKEKSEKQRGVGGLGWNRCNHPSGRGCSPRPQQCGGSLGMCLSCSGYFKYFHVFPSNRSHFSCIWNATRVQHLCPKHMQRRIPNIERLGCEGILLGKQGVCTQLQGSPLQSRSEMYDIMKPFLGSLTYKERRFQHTLKQLAFLSGLHHASSYRWWSIFCANVKQAQ